MPRRLTFFLLLLVFAVSAHACELDLPFAPEHVERFNAALDETHLVQGAVGTAMLVADEDHHRWVGVKGAVDLNSERPVTPRALFRSASIGKTFTGALILSLHEEERLSVEDRLSDYLALVPNGEQITLRMLLQHTSGIANFTKTPAYQEAIATDPTVTFAYEELVAFAVEAGADFPPGYAWNYSNTGYILLGMIAEQVGENTVFAQIEDRFLSPLGMADTGLHDEEKPPAKLWTGYRWQDGELLEVAPFTGNPADGSGYITSLDDMLTWSRAFFGGRLHRPETIAMAQETAGGEVLDQIAQQYGLTTGGYGLGLLVATGEIVGTMLAGAGNTNGARSFVGYLPARGLSFVVAVNIGDSDVPLVETLSSVAPLLGAIREM